MAEWGKLYGSLHGSPKWRRATKAARALWTTSLSWCIDQESTDGTVPADLLRLLDGTKSEANSLVSVGLWDETTGGWRFHNWEEMQRTVEQIERDREAARERKRRSRARQGDGHAVTHAGQPRDGHASVTPGVTVLEESRGEESREESLASAAAATPKRTKGTRIEQPFPVTPEMVQWARENVPGIDHRAVTERFVDYWAGVAGAKGVKLDWIATWRNWLRREADSNGSVAAKPTRNIPTFMQPGHPDYDPNAAALAGRS